jgi:hypothetical protein
MWPRFVTLAVLVVIFSVSASKKIDEIRVARQYLHGPRKQVKKDKRVKNFQKGASSISSSKKASDSNDAMEIEAEDDENLGPTFSWVNDPDDMAIGQAFDFCEQ